LLPAIVYLNVGVVLQLNPALDAEGGRTAFFGERDESTGIVLAVLRDLDVVADADSSVALDIGAQFLGIRGDSSGFQGAAQGTGQSAGDGGDQIVEGRRDVLLRLQLVELLDTAVDAKADRFLEILDVSQP
jgi:hypothetical protein